MVVLRRDGRRDQRVPRRSGWRGVGGDLRVHQSRQATDAHARQPAQAIGIFIAGGDRSPCATGAARQLPKRWMHTSRPASRWAAPAPDWRCWASSSTARWMAAACAAAALADPLGDSSTIEREFLPRPAARGHRHAFPRRNRLGRLVAFVAKSSIGPRRSRCHRPRRGRTAAVAVEGNGRRACSYRPAPRAGGARRFHAEAARRWR